MTRHIGIFLFDGVEELDAVGPWEVLSHWTKRFPEDGFGVSTVSKDGKHVLASKGLTLGAHHSFADAPHYDVFLHPGGPGTRILMRDTGHLDWVQRQRVKTPLMTSVCSGALVYAAAGLLENRPATTYWNDVALLAELDPTISLRTQDRYVDDGDLITSAGVSAGIDMTLHLVRRLAGPDRAREVRRGIQYDPEPPV
ncbi:transcriptional regulator GlxA family with amidase domain [Pseudarthrobacter sp. W1I19]|uniref:DJ-1/PfpI family protein n=1 Tax=Pseudarthrobacter sp. W1I19 TaxID=3042288 RepID=UPI00278B0F9A|nr:DJ-1/PfpI family protein [Pseudarthrobacter sp. W1I19]MDQ0923392.1 transcriptional regulator GlxA family with amidase domain [Pseudarthrobacter sp. W1I19]